MEVKEKKKSLFLIIGIVVIVILVILLMSNKNGNVEFKVKSSLERLDEKSDLETVNYTYNVVAKQCKKNEKCDKSSNDIDDFEYVVSCKGTVTAGIEFKDINVDVNKDNKTILITLPEATIKDTSVVSRKFLNGEDLPASELVNAEKLCAKTILEKSKKDKEILKTAKEQAQVVVEGFYSQLGDAFKEYKVEVK